MRLPRRRGEGEWSTRVSLHFVMAAGVALVIICLGGGGGGAHFRLAFYEVLVWVLPILLLTVVLMGRQLSEIDPDGASERFVPRWVLCMPMLGEAAALGCIVNGADNMLLRGTVLFAVGVTAGLLVLCVSGGATSDRPGKSTS